MKKRVTSGKVLPPLRGSLNSSIQLPPDELALMDQLEQDQMNLTFTMDTQMEHGMTLFFQTQGFQMEEEKTKEREHRMAIMEDNGCLQNRLSAL